MATLLRDGAVSRRTFLRGAALGVGAAAAARVLPTVAGPAAGDKVILGAGKHRYEWVKGWGELPNGMQYGNTHGCIVTDGRGRILLNTDTENAVIIFNKNGRFVQSWGKDFKGGAHGMTIAKEGGQERLYLAHHGRHEVVKATLDGEVLMTLPFPEKAGVYKTAAEYRPTSVAIGPNGDIYAADGYGLSWIHQYDAKGEYIRSWGGRPPQEQRGKNAEPGKMWTPHGIWLDTRGSTPLIAVADRENNRLQFFSLDGKFVSMVTDELRRPCHLHQRGTDIVIADLAGRVTIFDRNNKLVTHLGDQPDEKKRAQNKIPREQWVDGQFLSPHCARWDNDGNLYVMDWNYLGRITKLKRL